MLLLCPQKRRCHFLHLSLAIIIILLYNQMYMENCDLNIPYPDSLE